MAHKCRCLWRAGRAVRSVRSETRLVSSEPFSSAPAGLFWSRALRKWIISDVISRALCSLSFHSLSVRTSLSSYLFYFGHFEISPSPCPPFHSSRLSLVSSSFPPPVSPHSSVAFSLSLFALVVPLVALLSETSFLSFFVSLSYSVAFISLPSSSPSLSRGSFHTSSWHLSVLSSFSLLTTTSSSSTILFFFSLSLSAFIIFFPQKTFHWPLWITQRFIRFIALVRASGVVCVCVCVCI